MLGLPTRFLMFTNRNNIVIMYFRCIQLIFDQLFGCRRCRHDVDEKKHLNLVFFQLERKKTDVQHTATTDNIMAYTTTVFDAQARGLETT